MNWKRVTGYKKPEEVEIGKTTVYLRRNIEEAKDSEDNDCWTYEECSMNHEDYKALTSVAVQTLLERLEFQDDVQAELLLAQMDTQAILSSQDDALAEILLNQMEG